MKKFIISLFAVTASMLIFGGNLIASDDFPTLSAPVEAPAPVADDAAIAPVPEIAAAPAAKAPAVKSKPAITKTQKEQNNKFVDMLILYLPNRVMDFLDTVDVSLGFGPVVKAKAWATRYMAFGGGIGGSAKIIKAYNRQYGAGLESGWSASFMMLTAENTELYETTRGVQKYFEYHTGIPSINDSVYNFWRGPRDIFSIGIEAALFGEVDVEVHPLKLLTLLQVCSSLILKVMTLKCQTLKESKKIKE